MLALFQERHDEMLVRQVVHLQDALHPVGLGHAPPVQCDDACVQNDAGDGAVPLLLFLLLLLHKHGLYEHVDAGKVGQVEWDKAGASVVGRRLVRGARENLPVDAIGRRSPPLCIPRGNHHVCPSFHGEGSRRLLADARASARHNERFARRRMRGGGGRRPPSQGGWVDRRLALRVLGTPRQRGLRL